MQEQPCHQQKLQEEPTWKLHLAGTGGENPSDVSLLKWWDVNKEVH